VLPPQFRPVSLMNGARKTPLVADANLLYKDLLGATNNLTKMRELAGDDGAGEEAFAVYNAFKAVSGLGDPVTEKSKEKQTKGILKNIFGSSPKYGTIQRKLLSSNVDNVGRGVVSPNPDFDMDTIGVPESQAYETYGRYVARRLRRRGMKMTDAMQHVREKTPLAKQVLIEEMEKRPVIMSRAPVLHKFGIMGFKPRLVKGSTIQVSPLIVGGFNMDFDGDAANVHVPASREAVDEVYDKLLPSRQLISPADFKSPVHTPGQEYVGGLYHATAKRFRSDKPIKEFETRQDAIRAYRRGEIDVTDRIKVRKK